MSNILNQNPVVLDTFDVDVDIAATEYGNTAAPMFIENFVYDGLTAGDHIRFTDTSGNAIQPFTCAETGKTFHERPYGQPWRGLKMLATNASISPGGKVYIYLR